LCNSISKRKADEAEVWNRKAFEAQKAYWKENGVWSYEVQQYVTNQLVDELEEIREKCRMQINHIERLVEQYNNEKVTRTKFVEQFVLDVKKISLTSSQKLAAFTKMVFQFSVASMSILPPCMFCVVALGSLAKGEATPYSDLEYLFLIEFSNSETIAYFEKLALSSYFIIGNLQETDLGYMSIAELKGWFDDTQKSGFKIDGLKDGAGNIPTGNGSISQQNHFIVTPTSLFHKYKSVLDDPQDDAIVGDLTAKLQFTRLVYCHGDGAEKLLDQFSEQKLVLQPNDRRQEVNREMFIADAKKYGFKPTEDMINNGFSINTKKELYRYPSILLYNILIIFNISLTHSWKSLDNLKEMKHISVSLYEHILFLLACACYLRLSTYHFYDSAKDNLSVLSVNYFAYPDIREASITKIKTRKKWFLPQKLFNLHCEHSIPLKKHISACRVENNIEGVLKTAVQKPNWLVKFQTFHCCNRWSKGQDLLREHINLKIVLRKPEQTIEAIYRLVNYDFEELWNTIRALTYSLSQERKNKEALAYHLIIQTMIESSLGPKDYEEQQLTMAESKAEAGMCFFGLTEFNKAIEEYKSSLQIQSKLLSSDHEQLAKMYLCLGRSYLMLYRYQEAHTHLFTALQICHNQASKEVEYNYYGEIVYPETPIQPLVGLLQKSPQDRLRFLNNSSILLAHVLWNIGLNYFYTKYFELAFCFFSKAQKMFYDCYGRRACHRDISHLFYSLACASSMLGYHENAEDYFKRGIAMTIQIFGKKNRFKAAVLHYFAMNDSKIYHKIIFRMFFSLPRYRVAHSESATVISRYGLHLTHTGEYSLAENVLKIALQMYHDSAVSGNSKYPPALVSVTLSHLALNYWKQGKIQLAKKTFEQSLEPLNEIEKLIPSSVDLERGEIFRMMGAMHLSLLQYHNAIVYFRQAKQKFVSACNDPNHPKIYEVENLIRSTSRNLQNQ